MVECGTKKRRTSKFIKCDPFSGLVQRRPEAPEERGRKRAGSVASEETKNALQEKMNFLLCVT